MNEPHINDCADEEYRERNFPMNDPSEMPTPKTDAFAEAHYVTKKEGTVERSLTDFARQLERDLSTLRDENALLREKVETLDRDRARIDYLVSVKDGSLSWCNEVGGVTSADFTRGIWLGGATFDSEGKITDEEVSLLTIRDAIDKALASLRSELEKTTPANPETPPPHPD